MCSILPFQHAFFSWQEFLGPSYLGIDLARYSHLELPTDLQLHAFGNPKNTEGHHGA